MLEAAREAAEKDEADAAGWKFTLHMPSYLPVMQYADERALREKLYYAGSTRAAEFGKPEWDNAPLIARIVPLRREMAQLLGYRDFAEVSLVPKMAESSSQVLAFLDDLARRARPFAEADVEELREFSKKGIEHPGPAGLGRGLRLREIARQALRVLRPGSEAVLPRGRGGARPFPRGRRRSIR